MKQEKGVLALWAPFSIPSTFLLSEMVLVVMVGIIKGFNDISQMQAEEEACCRNPDRDEYNPDEFKK